VCEAEGSCLAGSAILYASATGAAAGTCEALSPCELLYARSLIDESRFTILLAEGSYSLSTPFDIDATRPRAHIVGGANVQVIVLGGPSFRVMAGGSLDARDITSNSVRCVGGAIALTRVSLLGAASNARIDLQSCDANIVGSVLEDSVVDGVFARNSDTRLAQTRLSNNTGNNITVSDGGKLEVADCTISGAGKMGVDVANATFVMTRSRLFKNHLGGARSLGGLFDVTNTFVFGNGNDSTATFGGLRLETSLPGARVEHNTIVRNDSNVNQSLAGGLFCVGAQTAPNNLIDGNFAGNTTQPQSQVAGSCSFATSIIRDGTVNMHYVALGGVGVGAGDTDDYHLASAKSPAVDVGVVGALIDDADGDPRSDGAPDVGADELVP
jgi:hypothetical protein